MQFYDKSKQLRFVCKGVIALMLVLVSSSFTMHKYYSSITKIQVDTSEKLLKMHTAIFADDFEKVLSERYQLEVKDFSEISEKQKQTIATYLTRKIKIATNRAPLEITFLGCEVENQLVYLYYEAPYGEKVQRLDIENTLLMDVFSSQHNTVDVTLDTTVKSVHLTHQNSKKTIFF